MEDIASELLKKIQDDFQEKFNKSELISSLYEKVRDGTATYKEANQFAIEVGDFLANAYGGISSDMLPDGKMYYNIAQRIITPTMENNYNLITDVTSQVQQALNEAAGIGINSIVPELNHDRIEGIINRLAMAEAFDDIAWILGEPIRNFSQSIVDDSIRANAEFHARSGMSPKIVRKLTGGCCDWCKAVAGIYSYPDVPKDVYRRHQRCRCTVDYNPGDGKIQNVHSKKWRSEEEYDKIIARRTIGLNPNELTAQERNVRANWKLSAMQSDSNRVTKREVLGTIPVERTEETINFFNGQIRNSSIEHAIVIDDKGNVIHFTGSDDTVDIYDVDLSGAYVTHNHPISNGIVSFGEDDFYFLRDNQEMASFFCCNPEYEYNISVLKPLDDISYNQIYLQGLSNSTIDDDVQDKAMETLADMGYVRYEKRRIK